MVFRCQLPLQDHRRLNGTREHVLPKANVAIDAGVPRPEDFMKVGAVRHWDREPKVRDLA